jgi:iron complex outermembrane receptor protein
MGPALALGLWAAAAQATPAGDMDRLLALGIEDLMQVQVVSTAARKPEPLMRTAAAVYVLTGEDIRRSGVTSIPEALRMVPGLHVARFDANKWSVSSRGFSGRLAGKLLVLIDGRSVYTPLSAGTIWEVQDTLLADIDRIEVIRGPGGTLWGANAVNGVINIITKNARDTQGGLLAAGGGTEERAFGEGRYGGSIGEHGYYRVYAKYFDRDESRSFDDRPINDGWQSGRGGFRSDWRYERDDLTVQGDAYRTSANADGFIPSLDPPDFTRTVQDSQEFQGANLLARWQRRFAAESNLVFQVYYDRTERDDPLLIKEDRDTVDLDFQHRFPVADRHDLTWGLGYRLTRDDLDGVTVFGEPRVAFDQRTDALYSAFAQDDIRIVRDRLNLIVGVKLEHNDYSGLELQPNARLLFTPSDRQTIWAAVSRAVRTPARGEHDTQGVSALAAAGPFPLAINSDGHGMSSEELLGFELGYRLQPGSRFFVEAAGFYNDYSNLCCSVQFGNVSFDMTPVPHLAMPLTFDTKMHGEAYGFEIDGQWQVNDRWRLTADYSYLDVQIHHDLPGDPEEAAPNNEGDTPHHKVSLRSSLDLPRAVEFDLWLRHVSSLRPPLDEIPAYTTFDARLAWRPWPALELALIGQNLVERLHTETEPYRQTTLTGQVERGVYGRLTLRF